MSFKKFCFILFSFFCAISLYFWIFNYSGIDMFLSRIYSGFRDFNLYLNSNLADPLVAYRSYIDGISSRIPWVNHIPGSIGSFFEHLVAIPLASAFTLITNFVNVIDAILRYVFYILVGKGFWS